MRHKLVHEVFETMLTDMAKITEILALTYREAEFFRNALTVIEKFLLYTDLATGKDERLHLLQTYRKTRATICACTWSCEISNKVAAQLTNPSTHAVPLTESIKLILTQVGNMEEPHKRVAISIVEDLLRQTGITSAEILVTYERCCTDLWPVELPPRSKRFLNHLINNPSPNVAF